MKSLLAGKEKFLIFGGFGAAGCFAGALVGEVLLLLLALAKPAPPPLPRVDVLFVLDVTSSMQPQIDGVRRGIIGFAESLSTRKLDTRIGLVAFRDRKIGEESMVLKFGKEPFTSDPAEFRREVESLRASGGGDMPESSLDALSLASDQPFRQEATRVLVLVTDAPPQIPDKDTRSVADAASALRQAKIDQLHLVIRREDRNVYEPLQHDASGEVFLLGDIAGGVNNFDKILPVVGERIAERTLKGLQSTSDFAPQSFWLLLVVTCLWTGALSLGVSLALIGGQNAYLRRPYFTPREAMLGVVGGLAAGAIAGGVGQIFFAGASSISALELIGRIAAWAMLGGLVGRGMAFFVPNLPPRLALLGGGVGGAAAAVGFLISSGIAGDVAGRLLGAAILGFCIGIMIALVELATRSIWLEVRYGAKEIVNITLGATPISFGSDARASTIYAREVRPIAFRYQLKDGQVVCDDFTTERTTTVAADVEKQIGHLVVTVRSGTQSKTAGALNTTGLSVPPAPPPPVVKSPSAQTAPPPAMASPLPPAKVPDTGAPATGTPATPGHIPAPPPPPAIKPPPPPPGRPAGQSPAAPAAPSPVAPHSTASGPADQGKIRPFSPPPPPPRPGTKPS